MILFFTYITIFILVYSTNFRCINLVYHVLSMQSGKVYLQRSKSPVATSSSDTKDRSTTKTSSSTVQDLNFPPFSSKKQPLTFIEDACLDLKLVPPANNYQSVCTLDKVKSALERAEIKSSRKRSSNSSSSSSHSTSSMKETDEEDEEKSSLPPPVGLLFAAGCPRCLLYVLISRNNPKCPRCDTVVASPLPMMKKPRIDLNLAV